jgi:Family of unknown function (DUF5989)
MAHRARAYADGAPCSVQGTRWTVAGAGTILGAVVSKGATVREFVRFLARRKRYWLLPMALTVLVLGILVVLTEGSAVAPFIYTLF